MTIHKCTECGMIFKQEKNLEDHYYQKNHHPKERQMDMAFHDALMAVLALEKWIPGADTHITISQIAKTIQNLEDKAREKHFPSKGSIHPVFDKALKTWANPGGKR